MDAQNNICIWIAQPDQLAIIPKVLEKIGPYQDLCIVSDLDVTQNQYAIMKTYYARFCNYTIIFLSTQDLIDNADNLKSNKIILCKTGGDDISSIGYNQLNNVNIISI